ncbi:hypothetical protein [Nocardioides mangrovi]|uniref:Secreted protein n=1 Tax=Nocardioides mangrovi TaxID=2874580 RepID=A0ABS7UHN3_9ACTN|nr:hypothetical protein [Nocardioides mangrovi]MBZ5740544.1 hypothetical protein [Nocardioides mangrovi]
MTPRLTRLLALVVPVVLCGTLAAVAPTYAGAARKASVDERRSVTVKWDAQKHRKRTKVYQKSADVPGIGSVDLVCQPKSTMIRLAANDRDNETQMWLAKFETKDGSNRVAVKNVRIYRYATAADDGTGGTGRRAHEGLNQKSPIEDYANGSAVGVISQRPGRDRNGGGTMSTPATAFKLSWYWERFAYPGYQFCKMKLTLLTNTDQQFGLSWHGNDEAATASTSTSDIAGFGQVDLTCEPGKNADQTVAFRPDVADSSLEYDLIQGEGSTDDPDVYDHVEGPDYDPVTGLVGPIDLPRNGMMRLEWTVGGVTKTWMLSSYMVVNNDAKPWLNVCEVAAAPLP